MPQSACGDEALSTLRHVAQIRDLLDAALLRYLNDPRIRVLRAVGARPTSGDVPQRCHRQTTLTDVH
jgi:hypothetical protein